MGLQLLPKVGAPGGGSGREQAFPTFPGPQQGTAGCADLVPASFTGSANI